MDCERNECVSAAIDLAASEKKQGWMVGGEENKVLLISGTSSWFICIVRMFGVTKKTSMLDVSFGNKIWQHRNVYTRRLQVSFKRSFKFHSIRKD